MSIKTVTDRERELEAALAEEQRINGMGAEREYVLQGQVTQLTRRVELCVQALVAREKELDELQYKLAVDARTSEILIEGANASATRAWAERGAIKAQLGDLTESQAAMLQEIKTLKEAISLAYGHLWHINTEMLAPVALYPPDQAASAARKSLSSVMTHNEKGNAIDAFRLAMEGEKS